MVASACHHLNPLTNSYYTQKLKTAFSDLEKEEVPVSSEERLELVCPWNKYRSLGDAPSF